MRRLGCVLLVSLVVALGAPSPATAEGVYAAPVDGPVVDRFRPPATPYGPGNRGIDYATEPGDDVRASAAGEVVFAGRIGPSSHVVVLHPDGLRTSYSFLAAVAVRRGDHVERGDVVGRAGDELHFGVRTGDDRYLDPEALLAGDAPDVHLVPVDQGEAGERGGLLRSLRGAFGRTFHATATGVAWARDRVADGWDRNWAFVQGELTAFVTQVEVATYYAWLPVTTAQLVWRGRLFFASQSGCTPATAAPPPPRPGRHIAVLVGGLGSSSGDAAVLDVDTRALGYADGDVAQFSYRGGQSPGRRSLAGVATTRYAPADSQGDIRRAARRLRALLEAIRKEQPGVPVDVIAHSQGGVVARLALGEDGDRLDPRLPTVANLVTLGTPHHGADLATANEAIGTSTAGAVAQRGVDLGSGIDTHSVAVAQLSERSDLMDDLQHRPLPPGARVTSIAAGGDAVVPGLQAGLDGATNVMIHLGGAHAHDRLPGAPATQRELALALAGWAPTCRGLLADVLGAAAVSMGEDAVGVAALVGGAAFDHYAGNKLGSSSPDATRSPGPVPPR